MFFVCLLVWGLWGLFFVVVLVFVALHLCVFWPQPSKKTYVSSYEKESPMKNECIVSVMVVWML